jgi:hypothetical protein
MHYAPRRTPDRAIFIRRGGSGAVSRNESEFIGLGILQNWGLFTLCVEGVSYRGKLSS